MLKVPYHRQEFYFSCLPACVRMVLDFYGIQVEERELRKLFQTTLLGGTNWKIAVEGIKKFNVELIYLKDQKIDKIYELLKQNYPVIVSIDTKFLGDFEHKSHVVVITDIDDKIIIHDPEKGENMKIDKNSFTDAWSARGNRISYIMKK